MRSAMLASGLLLIILTSALTSASESAKLFEAHRVSIAPVIDGDPSDVTWQKAKWREIDQVAIGAEPSKDDFSGRYKLVWTPEYLYFLAEITDEVLIDAHADPVNFYWEDDMFEILIDEDASGGIHLEDFNAFAYHFALDNQIVDIAPDKKGEVKPRLFPGHGKSRWQRSTDSGNKIYWEIQLAVHNDSHVYGDDQSSRVTLKAGKTMGLLVAYCDADDASGRQLFIGDVEVEPVNGDRNRGYIDASVFGKVKLVE